MKRIVVAVRALVGEGALDVLVSSQVGRHQVRVKAGQTQNTENKQKVGKDKYSQRPKSKLVLFLDIQLLAQFQTV